MAATANRNSPSIFAPTNRDASLSAIPDSRGGATMISETRRGSKDRGQRQPPTPTSSTDFGTRANTLRGPVDGARDRDSGTAVVFKQNNTNEQDPLSSNDPAILAVTVSDFRLDLAPARDHSKSIIAAIGTDGRSLAGAVREILATPFSFWRGSHSLVAALSRHNRRMTYGRGSNQRLG